MSADEWAFVEGFIRAFQHVNGRKPVKHRLVLRGYFLDRTNWCALVGSARGDRQVVLGLSPVLTLDAGRALGRCPGRAEPCRGRPGQAADDRQHSDPGTPLCGRRKKGARKEAPGRSRGRFTTKIHPRVNSGLPMRIEITPGQDYHYVGYDLMMPRTCRRLPFWWLTEATTRTKSGKMSRNVAPSR